MLDLLLYNAFLKSYYLGVKLASIKNRKAAKWIEGRKNVFAEVESSLAKSGKSTRRIWMHVSSLGEFEQGRPLIEKIKANNPEYAIILTFFSPSGYELRKNYELADSVFYLPLDGKENARKFIDLVKPDLAIFVKYEFWYYYFKTLKDKHIPLVMLSAIFRENQPFFKWYGSLHKKMLKRVTHFFVQDETSLDLLAKLQLKNVTQIPDTRIDRVWKVKEQAQPIQLIEKFLQGEKAFIGGSIYGAENELIANAFFTDKIPGRLILAPHNISDDFVEKLIAKWGNEAIRYTKVKDNVPVDKTVLIVDTIGMLNNLYQYAYMAIIGGGFGKSIHNILEPAAFGIPVLFGPNHHKFKEARDLLSNGGAFEINNQDDFDNILTKLYTHQQAYNSSANASLAFIENNIGGTEKVYIWLREKMLL